jgi:hypothetical protein
MCLEVRTLNGKIRVRTAKKDIPCLKIVEISNGLCFTPYMRAEISQETLEGKNEFLAESNPMVAPRRNSRRRYVLRGGYVHTYAFTSRTNKVLSEEVEYLCDSHRKSYVISVYRCVIPKGTEFVKGKTRWDKTRGYGSYASKSIRFTEKLAEFGAGCLDCDFAREIDKALSNDHK